MHTSPENHPELPVEDSKPEDVVDEATLDSWEAEVRKRLIAKIELHQSQIDAVDSAYYDDELERVKSGRKIKSKLSQDAIATAFQQLVKEGIATFGKDMANYDALLERFMPPQEQ